MKIQNKKDVIPAEAGIQQAIESYIPKSRWIPAFAGMTRKWDSSCVARMQRSEIRENARLRLQPRIPLRFIRAAYLIRIFMSVVRENA